MPRSDPAVTQFENRLREALDRFAEGFERLVAPTLPGGENPTDERIDSPAQRNQNETRDTHARSIAVRRLIALVQAGRYS